MLNAGGKGLALAARVYEPKSGRVLEVHTTEPGVQLYTATSSTARSPASAASSIASTPALCLEAQHFPDAVNQPQFPSIILRPGQTYRQTTLYKFSTAA